eukprot:1701934-Ditylum_brightwellii.AAC.1
MGKASKSNKEPVFNCEILESGRGFLGHIAFTYPMMVSYLRGTHHTIESWRNNQDSDGWKYLDKKWAKMEEIFGVR